MRWTFGCSQVDVKSHAQIIQELGIAYAENGWRGEPGDSDDRLHAAAASAFRVPVLATWERRFLEQEEWITWVNQRYGLAHLRLVRPDRD